MVILKNSTLYSYKGRIVMEKKDRNLLSAFLTTVAYACILVVCAVVVERIFWPNHSEQQAEARKAHIEEVQKVGFEIAGADQDKVSVHIAWRDPKGFVKAIDKAVAAVEEQYGRKVTKIGNSSFGEFTFFLEDE